MWWLAGLLVREPNNYQRKLTDAKMTSSSITKKTFKKLSFVPLWPVTKYFLDWTSLCRAWAYKVLNADLLMCSLHLLCCLSLVKNIRCSLEYPWIFFKFYNEPLFTLGKDVLMSIFPCFLQTCREEPFIWEVLVFPCSKAEHRGIYKDPDRAEQRAVPVWNLQRLCLGTGKEKGVLTRRSKLEMPINILPSFLFSVKS